MKNILTAAVMSVAISSAAFAATNASDVGSNYTTATWTNGANLGTGFGSWTLTTSGLGTNGFAGSYIGSTAIGDPAFGIYSGGTNTATSLASRPFTGGGLTAGQSFGVTIGNTVNISNPGEIGLSLMSGSSARWTLKFVGGGANWLLNDGGTDFSSGQAYAANTPLSLTFTYNGGSSYSYTFGTGSGNNFTASADISNLDGVQFFSVNQGGGENMGFNNMNVVPEPSTYALLALSAAAFGGYVARRRRRN